jgi:hypothetical protein
MEESLLPQRGGSVKKYQSPDLLEQAIESYFTKQKEDKKAVTVTGLAYHLGFASRSGLLKYEKEPGYEMFYEIISRAKLRIEVALEEELISRNGTVAGLIFNLKNNYNWQDAHVIQASTGSEQMDYTKLSDEEKSELHKLLKKSAK